MNTRHSPLLISCNTPNRRTPLLTNSNPPTNIVNLRTTVGAYPEVRPPVFALTRVLMVTQAIQFAIMRTLSELNPPPLL
jgi:hypothetical protein